jgi:hypothetical protein
MLFVIWTTMFKWIRSYVYGLLSRRLFAINSIPEVGLSMALKPLFIFLQWLQKNAISLSRFPVYRTTCLLNVLCGEFYININVILTSKMKHFLDVRLYILHAVRIIQLVWIYVFINKETSHQQLEHRQRFITPKQCNLCLITLIPWNLLMSWHK